MYSIKVGDKVKFRQIYEDLKEDKYVGRIGIFVEKIDPRDFDEIDRLIYSDFIYKIQLCDTGEIIFVNDGTVEKSE